MQSELECIVCLLKQAMNTSRIATNDEHLQRRIMNRIAESIPQVDLNRSPALNSTPIYQIIAEMTGNHDPYKDAKVQTNQEALKLLPEFKERVFRSDDQLNAALHLAAAGNIIDFGIGQNFDFRHDVLRLMETPFAIDHAQELEAELQAGKKLLYLGDNAGEIVFDRILIEYLLTKNIDITYTVKSLPVINDALMEDAINVGLTKIVNVIETGSGDIGINFDNVSTEFKKAFDTADIIIAKGHGNFETCVDVPHNFYFLLNTKCVVVAEELGVTLGDIVFKHQKA
jgi:damage-control phosphatase, subfamily I